MSRRSQLLKTRLDLFTRMLEHARKGDVQALHRARITSRRLREIVPVLGLPRAFARKLSRRLRKATRRLGAVRELDAVLIVIDEHHGHRREHHAALSRIAVNVSAARDEARRRLFDKHGPDFDRLSRKVGAAAKKQTGSKSTRQEKIARATSADERSRRWAVEARVARRAARLRTAIEEAGRVYLPDRLHAARIGIKKLRYALELSAEITRRKATADLRALKRAQDVLGRMRDLELLIDHARQAQAAVTPPRLMVWRDIDSLVASIEDECRRRHGRYMRLRDGLVTIAERYGREAGDGEQTVDAPSSRATG